MKQSWQGENAPKAKVKKANIGMLSSSPVWASPVWEGENGKWYFCDEVWSDCYGPYDTEEEAKAGCSAYAKTL